jgi:hypothetical protein
MLSFKKLIDKLFDTFLSPKTKGVMLLTFVSGEIFFP